MTAPWAGRTLVDLGCGLADHPGVTGLSYGYVLFTIR